MRIEGFQNNYQTLNDPINILNTDPNVDRNVKNENVSGEKNKKLNEVKECETCKNRRYQDVSDDPGVSFKSPTKVNPSTAASAVMSHEREHYSRETSKAAQEDKDVLSASIRIFTAICPECGKTYVSGGETRTVTATKKDKEENKNSKNSFEKGFDIKI